MTDIDKLNNERDDVQSQMDSLIDERLTFQNNLTSIKLQLSKGLVPDKLYSKLMEARHEYNKSVQDNLKIYRVLKNRKTDINNIIQAHDSNIRNSPEKIERIKDNLNEIKDKYFEFYRDKTRIPSMRKMASDFIIDLDKIIKTL